jgi:predicted GIY-YIG superfamily endonuclease
LPCARDCSPSTSLQADAAAPCTSASHQTWSSEWEHKEGFVKGFTRDHGVSCLVWFELHESAEAAITREKQLKKWNRAWKIRLIEGSNPYWNDLYATLH